jgi:hypothetical protein
MLDECKLALYWEELPTGKENAITYPELCTAWNMTERKARTILHALSLYDNGDDYILIRSSSGKGFYKTDNETDITAYRRECLNKGRSVFAPVKKINRVLNANREQYTLSNNLRVIRESKGLTQAAVCAELKKFDAAFDNSLLSKMENGVCLPTYMQLSKLAEIYGVEARELLDAELYY